MYLIHSGKQKVVIGMVHLLPSSGHSRFEEGNFEKSLEKAVKDALALEKGGADGCLIQTVDKVFPNDDQADYARVAAVSAITQAVSQVTSANFQIGVQILLNGISASLAVAKVCGGSFLRCTALIADGDTDWGVVKANPVGFFDYRKKIGAPDIKLIAEVEGMHYHWRGESRPVGEIAKDTAAMGADAVEIAHPDEATNLKLIREIKQAVPGLPVILGGHTNHENAARRLAEADGVFVGTCLEDQWGGSILEDRVREYVDIVRDITASSLRPDSSQYQSVTNHTGVIMEKEYFFRKEMLEQPQAIRRTLAETDDQVQCLAIKYAPQHPAGDPGWMWRSLPAGAGSRVCHRELAGDQSRSDGRGGIFTLPAYCPRSPYPGGIDHLLR